MTPLVVVNADVERERIVVAGQELDRLGAIQLIGELAHALSAIWPPVEPGWEKDTRRESTGGRVRHR